MIKKILFALACVGTLTACNEDFKDWADPQTNPEPNAVSFGNGSVKEVGVIDMANLADGQSMVKVADITAPTASSESYAPKYKLTLSDVTYDIEQNGEISVEDLAAFLKNHNILRPVETPISAFVEMWESNGKTAIKTATSGTFNVTVKPEAPVIEDAYYFTGTVNGWNNADTSLEFTNGGGDVYENPVFTCKVPCDGSEIQFKVTPKSGIGGDWSKCLGASETEGQFLMNNAGGNFVIPANAAAKFVEISFDMMSLTWSYKYLSFSQFVYFIGATDGWSKSEQRLESPAFDGVYTGFVYVADPNGWGVAGKFQRVAGSWDDQINAGNTTCVSGIHGSDNFEFDAEGVYYITLNLVNNTISAQLVKNMNLVGDFNGWNAADDAQQMTWDADNFCFVKENAGVTSNGWKFTTNNSWDLNLGGSLTNLVTNGDNIGVAGSTIKLYPCRVANDKICCTVE